MLKDKSFYMNPFTGSIDTGENWKAENWPEEELSKLIEVDKDGHELVEVE